MSQAGKVLHLYVEVRSVSEEDEKFLGRGDDGTNQLMLQCPNILTNSQRSSAHSSPTRSPDVSPVMSRRSGSGSHSLPSSKSSSRHSVSFQLQNSEPTGSSTQFQQQDVLYDSFGQLLEVLAPKTSNSGSLGRTCSSDLDPYCEKLSIPQSSTSCRWLTVPSPTNSNCGFHEDPEMVDGNGKTSLVSFGYIDKASVNSMAGHSNSMCLKETKNRLEGQLQHSHLQKRKSDPVCYNNKLSSDDTFYRHSQPSRTDTPRDLPYLSRATMDVVARDAMHKALEEFGSPKLKHRFAGHNSENSSAAFVQHHQSPHCRSWGGSPVPSCSTRTLPSKNELLELDRRVCHGSMNGLPRSPASDHLCAQVENSSHSVFSMSTLRPHCPTQSLQRQWVSEDHPTFSYKFHPPLPAGRPTDIQHEVARGTFNTSKSSRTDDSLHFFNKVTNTSPHAAEHLSYKSNEFLNSQSLYCSSRCSSRASDADSFAIDRRSVSPSSNSELDRKLSSESNKLSIIFPGNCTPSPTPSQAESLRSESPENSGLFTNECLPWQNSVDSLRMDKQNYNKKTEKLIPQNKPGYISPLTTLKSSSTPSSPASAAKLHRAPVSQSPALDAHQKLSSTQSKDRSDLHRYQPPQYTGGHKSPGIERKHYDHLFDGSPKFSPEVTRRHQCHQNSEGLPVSWTSRQQDWKESGLIQASRNTHKENHHKQSSGVNTQSKGEYCKRDAIDKGIQTQPVQEYQLPRDQRQAQDHRGSKGTFLQSSSGVTGSLGDGLQLDRNVSLSPETSSPSSHATADSSSVTQVG